MESTRAESEAMQDRLQIGDADVFVNKQSLELMKHRRMTDIRVNPIDAARCDQSQWRTLGLHGADLHRRCVRTQQVAVFKIERVMHGPRRMIGRDIQCLEVMKFVFDLRTVRDIKARAQENLLDAQSRLRDRMHRSLLLTTAWQCHIERARVQLELDRAALEFEPAGLDSLVQALLGRVDVGARSGTLGRRQCADGLELFGQCALAAEPVDADFIELGNLAGRCDLRQCGLDQGGELSHSLAAFRSQAATRLALARSAMTPKALASLTARSASNLRSISRPALCNP